MHYSIGMRESRHTISLSLLVPFLIWSSVALGNSIEIKLVSYKNDKDMFDDTPICELEFMFLNNSWGTIYGLNADVESYDDRQDKLETYGLNGSIRALGDMFSSIDKILVGNSATSKSLILKSKCEYISNIRIVEVEQQNCNIRRMPEAVNCIEIIRPSSNIEHIKLTK